MKNLFIVGAGRFGREVYAWARQAHGCGVDWCINGFLDSRRHILDGYKCEIAVLAAPETYEPGPADLFVCAIGDPKSRKVYCDILLERGAKFTNIIHPTVVMGENVRLGAGVILCPYVVVSSDVSIGDFVTINMHSFLAHDVVVGNYCQIHGHVSVNGGVHIKEGVQLGSNSALLPDSTIDEYAIVGAGSVVLRHVGANQTVYGNPAKTLGLPPVSSSLANGRK